MIVTPAIFIYLYSNFLYRRFQAAGDLCECFHNTDEAKQFEWFLPFLLRCRLIPHMTFLQIFEKIKTTCPNLPLSSNHIRTALLQVLSQH